MLSAADLSIADRESELVGVRALLDSDSTLQIFNECGIQAGDKPSTEYVRYKPGRRCISLIQTSFGETLQHFVLTAFPKLRFHKQQSQLIDAEIQGKSWQVPDHRIRIDRFPFDPQLRHIEKCFDENERNRLLRRILGSVSQHYPLRLETLAYKPGRRFVAAGSVVGESTASVETRYTFKFCTRTQFNPTLVRLRALRSLDIELPAIIAENEHYSAIALGWKSGKNLADCIAEDHAVESVFFEVGRQIARLHRCPLPPSAVSAVAAHDLSELAEFIGFLTPELANLATEAIRQTRAKLNDLPIVFAVIHGDFYAKQVIVDSDAVKFIDFDQAGVGNPYQDIGNFVAKLVWQSIQLGRDFSTASKQATAFLLGYRRHSGVFCEFAYRAHLAAGLLRCVTHPFRRATPNWPSTTREFILLAQSVLQPETNPYKSLSPPTCAF